MPFKYCAVKPTARKCELKSGNFISNPLGNDDEYVSLGDRIFNQIVNGEDTGVKINPCYDADDSNDINVTSSFRHDVLDIAEEFGRMPESNSPIIDDSTPEQE